MTNDMERRLQESTRADFQEKNEETSWGSVKISRKREITYGNVIIVDTYTAKTNDRLIFANPSSDKTITLPDSDAGKVYTITNTSNNTITIDGGNFNINGLSTIDIPNNRQSITLTFSGVEWKITSLGQSASFFNASGYILFQNNYTTSGGAAAEAITATGALASDVPFVQLQDEGTNNVSVVKAVMTANTLTVTFSGDPGNDAVISYQILRGS